jgi:hypothetical protein
VIREFWISFRPRLRSGTSPSQFSYKKLRNIFLQKNCLKNEYNEFRNTITKLLILSSYDLAHQDQDHQYLFSNLLWSLISLQFFTRTRRQSLIYGQFPRTFDCDLKFNPRLNFRWLSLPWRYSPTVIKLERPKSHDLRTLSSTLLINPYWWKLKKVNDYLFDCALTMILSWKTR